MPYFCTLADESMVLTVGYLRYYMHRYLTLSAAGGLTYVPSKVIRLTCGSNLSYVSKENY